MKKLIIVLTLLRTSATLFCMEPPTGSSSGCNQEVSELSIPLPSLQNYAAITYLKHSDANIADTLKFFDRNEYFADNPERLPDNLQQYLDRIRSVFHREPFTLSPEQKEKMRPPVAENPCDLPLFGLDDVGWHIYDDPRTAALASDCPDVLHYTTHHQQHRVSKSERLLKACVVSGALAISHELFQQSPPTPELATMLLRDIAKANYHPFYLFGIITPAIYAKLLEQHTRRLAIAKLLIEKYHANLEATGYHNETLLNWVTATSKDLDETDLSGHPYFIPRDDNTDNLAELLLKHGANINAQNNKGYSPLHHAVLIESIPLVKLLLRHHPDTTIRENSHDWTALDIANRQYGGTHCFQDAQGKWHRCCKEIRRLIEEYNAKDAYEGIAQLFGDQRNPAQSAS